MKLETYLRVSNTPFILDATLSVGPTKKKSPFISYRHKIIEDSELCIKWLIKHNLVEDLDKNLSLEEKAISEGFRYLLEDGICRMLVYQRWMIRGNFDATKSLFGFGAIPYLARYFVASRLRRKIASNLIGHGIGRHTPNEVYIFAQKAIDSLSDYLGQSKLYFFGATPTSLDCIALGVLSNLLYCGENSAEEMEDCRISEYVKEKGNLVAFVSRMMINYYPEFWLSSLDDGDDNHVGDDNHDGDNYDEGSDNEIMSGNANYDEHYEGVHHVEQEI